MLETRAWLWWIHRLRCFKIELFPPLDVDSLYTVLEILLDLYFAVEDVKLVAYNHICIPKVKRDNGGANVDLGIPLPRQL